MFNSATHKSSPPDCVLRVKCKMSSGLSEPLSDNLFIYLSTSLLYKKDLVDPQRGFTKEKKEKSKYKNTMTAWIMDGHKKSILCQISNPLKLHRCSKD